MKVSEIVSIAKAAEQLGFKDIELMIDNSRDGVKSLSQVLNARLLIEGDQRESYVFLVIS